MWCDATDGRQSDRPRPTRAGERAEPWFVACACARESIGHGTRARAHSHIVILIITGISISIDVNVVATNLL